MKFDEMFKVLPQEKENLKCEYKRCLATVLTPTHFPLHTPKYLGTAFFIEQLQWMFLK